MRILVLGFLLTGALAMATPSGDTFQQQWFHKKFGRLTPAEDQQVQAERANTAFRQDTSANEPAPNWMERYMKRRWGRYSPQEEARQKEERDNTAYRQEPAAPAAPQDLIEQHFRGKLGRSSPRANR